MRAIERVSIREAPVEKIHAPLLPAYSPRRRYGARHVDSCSAGAGRVAQPDEELQDTSGGRSAVVMRLVVSKGEVTATHNAHPQGGGSPLSTAEQARTLPQSRLACCVMPAAHSPPRTAAGSRARRHPPIKISPVATPRLTPAVEVGDGGRDVGSALRTASRKPGETRAVRRQASDVSRFGCIVEKLRTSAPKPPRARRAPKPLRAARRLLRRRSLAERLRRVPGASSAR